MFPGWSFTSEKLQDIQNNYRPQTLVVSGFTGKNHMFVQPLGSCRAPVVPKLSSRAQQSSLSPDSVTSSNAKSDAEQRFVPTWVKYHGVVLSFTAVRVPSNDEVVILYHLSDGTYEVKKDGKVYLKRLIGGSSVETRYAMPDPYAIEIGAEINIAGHVFRILDADPFTRSHMEEIQGMDLGPAAAPLSVTNTHETTTDGVLSKLTPVDSESGTETKPQRLTAYLSRGEDLKEILKEGVPPAWRGTVLHVSAIEVHERLERFVVSFYVDDASVELRLVNPYNEQKTSMFLSRTSFVNPLAAILGEATHRIDRAFQPTDFLVGSHLKLCGRHLLVYKMSEDSKAWISNNIEGVDETRLLEISVDDDKSKANLPKSNDDQLIEAQPPPPPGLETMQFLASGTDGRRFVMSVHCADSTISIRELAQEKGRVMTQGSKFLQRGHNNVRIADFYIGSTVVINCHVFNIIDADRATLAYIATNPDFFEAARADDAVIHRVTKALRGGSASTIADLAENSSLQDIPKAKLISACVLLAAFDGPIA